MIAAIASKIRTMAKLAGARGGSGELAQRFGLAPWQVDRARRDLQGWTDAGLGRAIEALAETDAQVKGGGRDPVYALERLVETLSSGDPGRRPHAPAADAARTRPRHERTPGARARRGVRSTTEPCRITARRPASRWPTCGSRRCWRG